MKNEGNGKLALISILALSLSGCLSSGSGDGGAGAPAAGGDSSSPAPAATPESSPTPAQAEPENDDEEAADESIVGTWYRYSFGGRQITPSKLVLSENDTYQSHGTDCVENGEYSKTDEVITFNVGQSDCESAHFEDTEYDYTLDGYLTLKNYQIMGFQDDLLYSKDKDEVIYNLSEGAPKFVETDFMDLNKADKISKFRSGEGHDYADSFEECRTMKHYYSFHDQFEKDDTVEIYSPVAGTIMLVIDEGNEGSDVINKQIHIKPDAQPAFRILLFHVDILSTEIAAGKKVEAGELVGYANMSRDPKAVAEGVMSTDISVEVGVENGVQYISYMNILEDDLFADYQAADVQTREEFIIDKETRDAHPLTCDGETYENSGDLEGWTHLNN